MTLSCIFALPCLRYLGKNVNNKCISRKLKIILSFFPSCRDDPKTPSYSSPIHLLGNYVLFWIFCQYEPDLQGAIKKQQGKSCLTIPLQESFRKDIRPGLWGHEILIRNLYDSLCVKIKRKIFSLTSVFLHTAIRSSCCCPSVPWEWFLLPLLHQRWWIHWYFVYKVILRLAGRYIGLNCSPL